MQKSTLKFWDDILKSEFSVFDKSAQKNLTNTELKNETIKKILSYASSVRGIKTKSRDRILITLN